MIKSEKQTNKKNEEKQTSPRDQWGTIRGPKYISWELQKEKRKRSREKIRRDNGWNSPNLIKDTDTNIQAQQIPK